MFIILKIQVVCDNKYKKLNYSLEDIIKWNESENKNQINEIYVL